MRVSTLTATAALILAVFGPVSAGAAAKSDAPADTQIDWSPCPSSEFGDEVAAAVQCAIVDVPVDYRHPRGPTLSLRIARRPATVSPSLGPLFVNPGGPGASAVSFATTFAAREAFLPRQGLSLDQFDVIGMDPRGVGGSTRLQCPEASELPQIVVSQPGEPLTPSERAMTAFAEGCADDPNVRFFGTNNVARDMDRVRELLGADTITYLGTSYGTEIGAAYLNLFPNHVRAAVLDAAADPTEDYIAFAIKRIRAQTRAFERYLDHCESDDCAWTKGADPRRAWEHLLDKLDRDPVRLSDGTKRNGDDLAAFALTAHGREFSETDERLDALVADEDADEIFSEVDQDPAPFLASNCLDYPISDYHDALTKIARAVGRRAARTEAPLLALCSAWPTTDDRVAVSSVGNSPPVVVIAARGDSQTPYESGVSLARGLGVPLVTWDANVHGAYGTSSCVSKRVVDLLVDLTPVPAGATCPNDAVSDAPGPPEDPRLN